MNGFTFLSSPPTVRKSCLSNRRSKPALTHGWRTCSIKFINFPSPKKFSSPMQGAQEKVVLHGSLFKPNHAIVLIAPFDKTLLKVNVSALTLIIFRADLDWFPRLLSSVVNLFPATINDHMSLSSTRQRIEAIMSLRPWSKRSPSHLPSFP